MFRKVTAALVHDLDGCLASVDSDSHCVRVRVLSNGGPPDHYEQLVVGGQLADMIATAVGDATLAPRGGPAGGCGDPA